MITSKINRNATSTDKESWKTVSEIKATGESAKCTFDCKLDLKNYEEGSVFVRAKVYDSYGNVTEDKDLTCYEYVVDRKTADSAHRCYRHSRVKQGNMIRKHFVECNYRRQQQSVQEQQH